MEINGLISEIALEFPKSYDYFKEYTKTNEQVSLQGYYDSLMYLRTMFAKIDEQITFDETTGVFYRNILGMYDEYTSLCNEVLILGDKDFLKTYTLYNQIDTQIEYINKHLLYLERSYLDYHKINYEQMLTKYRTLVAKSYIVILIALVFSTIFIFIAFKKIINSLNYLVYQAKMLSEKHWDVADIETNQYEELEALSSAFNNMKHEIKDYIIKEQQKVELSIKLKEEQLLIAQKDKLLKETQLMALQMQMNPHFLFNTLNIISRLALFKDVPEIMEVTQALSEILRYNLSYNGELVSLTDELEVLKAYIDIQSIRFTDNILFEFDICDETDDIKIPPMILQPIVENAIIHGCKDKKKDGKICVIVYQKDGYMNIVVMDNGNGMMKQTASQSSKSIGLDNVATRLKLVYNQDDLLEISSKQNKGTCVNIKIPM
jgi:sensor histidine kinase YesM